MKLLEDLKKKETIFFIAVFVLSFVFLFLHQVGVGLWEISPGKSLVRCLAIIFFVVLVFCILSQLVRRIVHLSRKPVGETTMIVGLLRALAVVAIILAVVESIGKLTVFTAVGAGFVGLLLGWSLQAPVSGIAAWVLITLWRPFRIGDRVQFPSLGLVGDIKNIGLMYVVLDQVGGTVGSEESTGRFVLVPNAMLFSQVAINYTSRQEEPYVLDEVIARITFDSDWKAAEKILMNAAAEVTAHIMKRTGTEPYIRSDIYDYGVYLRLRYMTDATNRPAVAHEINKRIFEQFQKNPKVDFAIPYVYSYRAAEREKADSIARSENK